MGKRIRVMAGAGWRFALILAVVVALVLVPLVTVQRAEGCAKAGGRDVRWTVALPGADPPSGCSEIRSGFDVLRDEIGR